MKTLKIFAALIMISILSAGTGAFAEELKKEYNESWNASEITTLEVVNKFGEVRVNNEGGDQVTIDVVVTVEARNEKKAQETLDKIEVNFSKVGGRIKAVTSFESNFKGQTRFSIDYVVNVPSDKNLVISNKYGNTFVNELEADGRFDIRYGNFSANNLETPAEGSLSLAIAYGNATIGGATHLNAQVSYTPVSIEEVKKLKMESKYSSLEVEEAGDIQIESRYDKIRLEEVNTLDASTKYSHIKIGELATSLKVTAGYGGISVNEVKNGFEFINIRNSYGKISLGLDELNYLIDAECDYCGIAYPEEKFSGDRIKENHSRSINGKIGDGSGGKVKIESRYGEIDLD